MTGKQAERTAEVLSDGLVQLVHARRGQMSARQRFEGGQSLAARMTWSRRRPGLSVGGKVGSALLVAAVAVGIAIGAREWHTVSALSYAVTGGHLDRDGSIEAESPSPASVRFSDGTEVLLDRQTKASVRSVDGHGARVSLTEGTAHVDVFHKPEASWFFDAGPFLVKVTGTAFTLAWRPDDQQLDLRMDRGTVEVSGPLSDGSILLRAGQHLIVRVRQRETLIRDAEEDLDRRAADLRPSEPVEQGAPAPAGTDVDPEAKGTGGGTAPHASRRIENVDWSADLAKGGFERIVEEAERWGPETILAEASRVNLVALADAARYARHDDLARRALLAQKRRFPGSSAARDASFLLGRLEESQHDVAGAIGWFDRYLADSPSGTYASEALGRKMLLVRPLYGDTRACAVAQEYLDRFPQGVYAARARALARTP
jgi:ferric-dicitrate binding protein FerR (iron transport regulator)